MTDNTDPFAGFQSSTSYDGQDVTEEPKESLNPENAEDRAKREERKGAAGPDVDDEDAAEVDPDDEDADDGAGEGEDGLGEDDPEEDDPDAEDEPPAKKKKPARARINELTAARREAERRVAALEQELSSLRKPAAPAGEEGGDGQEAPATGELKAPDPLDFKYGEVDPKYAAAREEYLIERTARSVRKEFAADKAQSAAEQEQQRYREKWDQLGAKGVERYDDFEEAVIGGAKNEAFVLTPDAAKFIADSEIGDELIYHLAKNGPESREIAQLPTAEQYARLGRIEGRILAQQERQQSEQSDSSGEKKAPKAAPPAQKRVRGAGGRFADPANMSFPEFEAHLRALENKG